MERYTISSLSEFLALVEKAKKSEEANNNKADFIYRGQREDKPLRPRLGRLVPKGKRKKIERLMFDEFKRTSIALTDLQPDTDWDFLSIGQHHNLPTRLLDWTYRIGSFVVCRREGACQNRWEETKFGSLDAENQDR